jgi:putative transposase
MSHSLTSLHYHAIFSTKERRPLVTAELKPDLLAYVGGIVRNLGGKVVMANAMENHVHLLITLPSTLDIADCMRMVKANSSKWVNEKRGRFGWQRGFAAFTVSTSNMPDVARYIRDQERHHRKITFQEELIAFLKKNPVAYDPKYIWE